MGQKIRLKHIISDFAFITDVKLTNHKNFEMKTIKRNDQVSVSTQYY